MAKSKSSKSGNHLLRWSEHIPASDVTDPLGLGLRGSTRIASLLLYCITSITPRARYYSFLPWCIANYQKHEQDKKYSLGLKEAIKLREKALTYGCIVHHDGKPCDGGSLVGTTTAQKWWPSRKPNVNLSRLQFAKNPALNAYLNSLVNLGFFVEQDITDELDEELDDSFITIDDIELSDLGKELAESYDKIVGRLAVTKAVSTRERTCTTSTLKEFGKRGGLCELSGQSAPDRPLLTDIFFARKGLTEKSHFRRNRSLILMLELCRQLSDNGWQMNSYTFLACTYYGRIVEDGDSFEAAIPSSLVDIATRWKMFYFHHFMGIALEGILSWLLAQLSERGLSGSTLNILTTSLHYQNVGRELSELLGKDIPSDFGNMTPAEFFSLFGVPTSELSDEVSWNIDKSITAETTATEIVLENMILSGEYKQSPVGLALPCILLALSMARYKRWADTPYGHWLASDAIVRDPFLDLLPCTVLLHLDRNRKGWWQQSWADFAEYVISRFIVQQHLSMAFEKTANGDRYLLSVDGDRLIFSRSYDKIGLGNPRLNSAFQILTDLSLWAMDNDEVRRLSTDGISLLKKELDREGES
jgi:hypothetical protein